MKRCGLVVPHDGENEEAWFGFGCDMLFNQSGTGVLCGGNAGVSMRKEERS
jgi:hypothetical protein